MMPAENEDVIGKLIDVMEQRISWMGDKLTFYAQKLASTASLSRGLSALWLNTGCVGPSWKVDLLERATQLFTKWRMHVDPGPLAFAPREASI
jgi:hypothetical protein